MRRLPSKTTTVPQDREHAFFWPIQENILLCNGGTRYSLLLPDPHRLVRGIFHLVLLSPLLPVQLFLLFVLPEPQTTQAESAKHIAAIASARSTYPIQDERQDPRSRDGSQSSVPAAATTATAGLQRQSKSLTHGTINPTATTGGSLGKGLVGANTRWAHETLPPASDDP